MTIDTRRFTGSINIKTEYQILLVLALLHNQGKITRPKLMGQIKALRAGTLTKRKETHHCEITDKWYYDEDPYQIYEDCLKLVKQSITFEELIPYIMLYNGKNHNFAINTFLEHYISPLIREWDPSYHDLDFMKYIDLKVEIKPSPFLGHGFRIEKAETSKYYCDCGCSCSRDHYFKNEYCVRRDVSKYFHTFKKGDLFKIPYFEI